MFPTLPEDLGTLSVAELKALRDQIREAAASKLKAGGLTTAQVGEVTTEMSSLLDPVLGEITARSTLASLEADAAADEEPEDVPEPEAEVEEVDEVEETDDDEAAVEEPEVPALAGKGRKPPAARGASGQLPAVPESKKRVGVGIFRATDGVPTKKVGESFDDWADLAEALMGFARTVRGNSDQRFNVAQAEGNFTPAMRLSEKPVDNLKLFDEPWKAAEELTAALCAPLPPVYDLACMNATNRPVKASLPNYAAPRGGVQIYPSPSLEDITTGYGIWDRFMDANPSATKDACATIKCATPTSYYIYGIYRCLTVKNLLAMTFPELVEAYLNRLAALQARRAETTLLEAMATETTTISAHTLGYNATTSIATNILNYLALYREQQRWDDQEFDAWLPRWIVPALQADLMRRKRTDGGTNGVPSEGEVRAVFQSAGVTPHFFRDTPSWATPIPKLQTSGVLGWFPRNLEMLVAPRGKFALMDRGELNIGVTGNVMRDNTSLSKNEFTFFFENFEGIVNTTSCPAHVIQFNNLCFNGAQIADLVINCEGGDQTGAAS